MSSCVDGRPFDGNSHFEVIKPRRLRVMPIVYHLSEVYQMFVDHSKPSEPRAAISEKKSKKRCNVWYDNGIGSASR